MVEAVSGLDLTPPGASEEWTRPGRGEGAAGGLSDLFHCSLEAGPAFGEPRRRGRNREADGKQAPIGARRTQRDQELCDDRIIKVCRHPLTDEQRPHDGVAARGAEANRQVGVTKIQWHERDA